MIAVGLSIGLIVAFRGMFYRPSRRQGSRIVIGLILRFTVHERSRDILNFRTISEN